MKLISLHIDGFGKLKDFDYEFDEFYNVIYEDNGWGKSTFASFIRVMFYGFDNESKKSVSERERNRFKPWSSSLYGGRIIFVDDEGEILTLYRHFGNASKDDSFELFDERNMKSTKYHENIGEELFHIDAESFKKTIFFTQNDITSDVTNSVQAKLGNVFMNNDDINRYDEVDEKLGKKLTSLSATRATGELAKLKNSITELNTFVNAKSSIENRISNLKCEIDRDENIKRDLLMQIQTLREQQKEIATSKDLQTLKQEYTNACLEQENRLAKMEELKALFNGVIPKAEDLNIMGEKASNLKEELINANNYKLDEYEFAKYEMLLRKFKDGVPSSDELMEMKNAADKFETLTSLVNQHQLSDNELKQYEELNILFKNAPFDISEINILLNDWNNIQSKKSTIENRRLLLERDRNERERREEERLLTIQKKKGTLLFIGVLLLAAGVVSYVFIHKLLGLGLATLSIFAILYSFRFKISDANSVAGTDNEFAEQIESDQKEIDEVISKVKEFLACYHKDYVEAMVVSSLSDLKRDMEDYSRLSVIMSNDEFKNERTLRDEFNTRITVFLKQYYSELTSSYSSLVVELIQDAATFISLSNRKNDYENTMIKVNNLTQEIKDYLSNLQLQAQSDLEKQISELKINLQSYLTGVEELQKSNAAIEMIKQKEGFNRLADYKEELGTSSLETLNSNLSELEVKVKELDEALITYKNSLDDANEELDEIQIKEVELEEKKLQRLDLTNKVSLLEMTREYLKKARDLFVDKYMSPIMNGFKKYYGGISESDLDKYSINANFDIVYLEDGSLRNKDTLSSGYQDLVGICLRLGLVDAMYHNEKPFLVLDDPFVNVDDQKIAKAKQVLKQVSENYQVIYFTCHESFK